MEPIVGSQVRHLYEVERLSIRQIAKKLRMARKTVARVIRNERVMRLIRMRSFDLMRG